MSRLMMPSSSPLLLLLSAIFIFFSSHSRCVLLFFVHRCHSHLGWFCLWQFAVKCFLRQVSEIANHTKCALQIWISVCFVYSLDMQNICRCAVCILKVERQTMCRYEILVKNFSQRTRCKHEYFSINISVRGDAVWATRTFSELNECTFLPFLCGTQYFTHGEKKGPTYLVKFMMQAIAFGEKFCDTDWFGRCVSPNEAGIACTYFWLLFHCRQNGKSCWFFARRCFFHYQWN